MLLPCRHYLSYTSSVDTPKQRRGEANPEQIPQTEGQTLESDDQDVVVMLNKDLRTTPAIMECVVTLEGPLHHPQPHLPPPPRHILRACTRPN